jgi:CheY-like chemotaxis protein
MLFSGSSLEMQRFGRARIARSRTTGMNKTRLAGRRVLVVEDDRLVREELLSILRSEGAHPDAAESGEGAVEIVAKGWSFDVMLVDLTLPGIDGAECARLVRAMRQIVRAGSVGAIVAMSGDPDRLAAHRDSFDATVVKPFSRDALVWELQRLGSTRTKSSSS